MATKRPLHNAPGEGGATPTSSHPPAENPPAPPRKEPRTAEEPSPAQEDEIVPKDTTNELCLNISGYMRPFDAPKYPEVAGLQHFEQERMMCYPI